MNSFVFVQIAPPNKIDDSNKNSFAFSANFSPDFDDFGNTSVAS